MMILYRSLFLILLIRSCKAVAASNSEDGFSTSLKGKARPEEDRRLQLPSGVNRGGRTTDRHPTQKDWLKDHQRSVEPTQIPGGGGDGGGSFVQDNTGTTSSPTMKPIQHPTQFPSHRPSNRPTLSPDSAPTKGPISTSSPVLESGGSASGDDDDDDDIDFNSNDTGDEGPSPSPSPESSNNAAPIHIEANPPPSVQRFTLMPVSTSISTPSPVIIPDPSSQDTPSPSLEVVGTDGSTLYPTKLDGLSNHGDASTSSPVATTPNSKPTVSPGNNPTGGSSQDTPSPTTAMFNPNGRTNYPTTLDGLSAQGTDPTSRPTRADMSSSSGPTGAPSLTTTEAQASSTSPSAVLSSAPSITSIPTTSVHPSSAPTNTSTPTASPTSWHFDVDGHDRDEVIERKCGISSSNRSKTIMHAIQQFSGPNSLSSGRSPKFRAYNWINRLDERVLCPEDDENEQHDGDDYQALLQRYILAVFYFSMLGNDWILCSGYTTISDCATEEQRWLSEATECDWHGITCNNEGRVTHLDLPNNGLDGTLPVELFSLTSMEGLSLGHNGNIMGNIPSEIAQLDKLIYLDLDGNDLTGPFPNVYSTITLQAIDLNNNHLSGSIDSAIGRLDQLVVLQIENNAFDGTLPMDAMTYLDQLVLFSSQGNNWTDHDWEVLCAWVPDRRAALSQAYLQFLLADCGETGSNCSCCSVCF